MAVTVERALRVAVGGVIAREVPDDECLVARSGKEHVRAAKASATRPSLDCQPLIDELCIGLNVDPGYEELALVEEEWNVVQKVVDWLDVSDWLSLLGTSI